MNRESAQFQSQQKGHQADSTPLLMIDAKGVIEWVNPGFTEATGYALSEAAGKGLAHLLHRPEVGAGPTDDIQDAIERGVGFSGQVLQYDKSGAACNVDLVLEPICNAQGVVTNFVVQRTAVVVANLKKEEREEQIGRQRNVLVREVHHRIKNSLQGVVGLLRQHVLEHPETAICLEKAIAQVRTVAVVHGLEGQAIFNEVVLCEMVPSIAGMVEGIIQPGCQIEVQVHVPERICVDEQERVPLALVINELILNAAKHSRAYSNTPSVTVSVVWETEEQAARVSVSNSGALPATFDFGNGVGLGTGLELVGSLLPPQGADLSFHSSDGHVDASLILFPPAIYGLKNK